MNPTPPRFLTELEVLALHRTSIEMYGGADGVLDHGELDSVLAMPRQGFGDGYAHEFPFEMAAAYEFHIAMNRAFRDGNKRTAFAAMVVFLHLDGWTFRMPDADAADLMLTLIEQHRDKPWLAGELRRHSVQRPPSSSP